MSDYEALPPTGLSHEFDEEEIYSLTEDNTVIHVFLNHDQSYDYCIFSGPDGLIVFRPEREEAVVMELLGFDIVMHDELDATARLLDDQAQERARKSQMASEAIAGLEAAFASDDFRKP